MSIQVNDFQWEPEKNDAEYIKLLESSRDKWQRIAQKAIAKLTKLKALLKEQEPRVMPLEEVRCANEKPMWFESKGTFRGQKGFWVLSKGVSPSYVIRLIPAIGKDDTELSLTAYGKVWRCWTSQPTDAQMKVTPWNI